MPSLAAQPDDLRRRAEELIKHGEKELPTRSDPRAALKFFQQSLDLARQLNDRSLISRSLSKLSLGYIYLGELGKGLSLAEEALSVARLAGDQHQEAWALHQVGNAYFYLGDFAKALENFQAALRLMREVGDRFGEANALRDVGITYKLLGQFDEALEFLHEALDIFRQLKVRGPISPVLENLGMGYASLGEYRLALDAYEQALGIARENQNAEQIYGVLTRMGYLYMDLNNPERALDHFQQALALAEELGLELPYHQAWGLQGMSWALHELGQVEAAIEAQRRSLRLDRQMKNEMRVADDFRGLGHLYLDRDPALATRYFQRAVAISEKYEARFIWRDYAGLAQAYRRQGDLDRAIEYYQRAIDRLESVRGQLASEQHKATFLGKHQRMYQELIEALMERYELNPEAGDDIRAFAIFERAKARAMLDAIAEARLDIGRELEPDLRQRQEQLNARIASLQKRIVEANMTKEERQQMLQQLSKTEQEFDRLIVEIKRRNPRYAALRHPEPLSLEKAQALLDEHTVLLAYFMTQDQVFAFLLTAKAFHAERRATSSKVLTACVQNYIDLIAQDESDGWQAIGRRLYTELVAPLRQHLPPGINRLIIIPDGVLHYLPFETLIQETSGQWSDTRSQNPDIRHPPSAIRHPRGDQRPHYLLEDFTISYAPSVTVLAELNAAQATIASAGRADLLTFADPALATGLLAQSVPKKTTERTRALYEDEGLQVTPIPSSAAEANAIARYAGRGSEVYTGGEASERRVKNEQLDRFRVIHFATHGLISQRTPARSALVLASGGEDIEDGFLQAREIYHLKLTSDLVVLSACQTARGQILAGEGVQGLAQAFFYAGAQSVVASLWNVNDERTATFMAAFYRHLADGQSKAAALRAAKLDLLQESVTSAPRSWAPFILIGEADEPVPISGQPWWLRNSIWLLLSAVLSLVGLVTLFLVRRRAIG